jgi:hypothetical protein
MPKIPLLEFQPTLLSRALPAGKPSLERPLVRRLQILLLCLLVAIYTLYRTLPLELAGENHLLENTQAIVLGLGFLLSLYFAYLNHHRLERKIWPVIAVVWLILCGRELNWGRVFFALPATGSSHSAVYPPLQSLWYGPAVYPLIFLALAGACYGFFKSRCDRIVAQWIRQKRFPILELAIAATAIFLASQAEGDPWRWLGKRHQLLEELLELLAYLSLFIGQLDTFWKKPLRSGHVKD